MDMDKEKKIRYYKKTLNKSMPGEQPIRNLVIPLNRESIITFKKCSHDSNYTYSAVTKLIIRDYNNRFNKKGAEAMPSKDRNAESTENIIAHSNITWSREEALEIIGRKIKKPSKSRPKRLDENNKMVAIVVTDGEWEEFKANCRNCEINENSMLTYLIETFNREYALKRLNETYTRDKDEYIDSLVKKQNK